MKGRQLIWLGGALVLLLGVAFLAGVFDTEFSTVDVPELDIPVEEVSAVRAAGADGDVAVRKEGATWRITEPVDAPADSAVVSRLIRDLSSMELQAVVSTNPERYGSYGVDSTGTEVTVEWAGGERTITVGDEGPGFGSTFVRLNGDESVYLASAGITVPEGADAYRDKTILDLGPAGVSQVSVQGPGRSYTLGRQDGVWMVNEEPADSAAAARYVGRFDGFRADGFFDAAPSSSDSTYTVRLGLDAGGERVLRLTPAEGDYSVTVDGGETVYRLGSFRFSQYVPEASQLLGAE